MNFKDIKPGTRLKLYPKNINPDTTNITLPLISKLESVEKDRFAYIVAPIHKGNIYRISDDTIIRIFFVSNHNLFVFNARIIEYVLIDKIKHFKIELQDDLKKIQRRNFFRLSCALPVMYKEEPLVGSEKKQSEGYTETYAKNLSGNGLCILTNENLECGAILDCKLMIDENIVVSFTGRVRRTNENEEGRYKYETGVEYVTINNIDKEEIIKFIYDEQRKLMKKGLI